MRNYLQMQIVESKLYTQNYTVCVCVCVYTFSRTRQEKVVKLIIIHYMWHTLFHKMEQSYK
ncbi:hypothetical protein ACTZMK_11215, partial [Ornithobacterium rhinotracheale]